MSHKISKSSKEKKPRVPLSKIDENSIQRAPLFSNNSRDDNLDFDSNSSDSDESAKHTPKRKLLTGIRASSPKARQESPTSRFRAFKACKTPTPTKLLLIGTTASGNKPALSTPKSNRRAYKPKAETDLVNDDTPVISNTTASIAGIATVHPQHVARNRNAASRAAAKKQAERERRNKQYRIQLGMPDRTPPPIPGSLADHRRQLSVKRRGVVHRMEQDRLALKEEARRQEDERFVQDRRHWWAHNQMRYNARQEAKRRTEPAKRNQKIRPAHVLPAPQAMHSRPPAFLGHPFESTGPTVGGGRSRDKPKKKKKGGSAVIDLEIADGKSWPY
jgi:hypothetical protein